MIPLYIISMDEDQHRRDILLPILDDLNNRYPLFDIHIFRAINGRKTKDAASFLYTHHMKWTTPSMKGCAMSHMMLWKKIAEKDELAVILEDDSIPSESFFKDFEMIVRDKLVDNDILHMCSFWDRKQYMTMLRPRHGSFFHYWFNTAAYMITRRGAATLYSEIIRKTCYHIDMCITGVIYRNKIRSDCVGTCKYFVIRNDEETTHNTDRIISISIEDKNIQNGLNTVVASVAGKSFSVMCILMGMMMCMIPWPVLLVILCMLNNKNKNAWILYTQAVSIILFPPVRIVWACIWFMIGALSVYLFQYYSKGEFVR